MPCRLEHLPGNYSVLQTCELFFFGFIIAVDAHSHCVAAMQTIFFILFYFFLSLFVLHFSKGFRFDIRAKKIWIAIVRRWRVICFDLR